jgi:hypothetical protein
MPSLTLAGPNIKLYINNKSYNVTQSLTLDIDYGEDGIYGIDCPWAQEIAGGRAIVKGSVRGVRTKYSGGIQAINARPAFTDLAASPYISIRIQDYSTGEDIALITNAKVTRESHSAATKDTYKLNFDFIGQIILFALDRA